MIKTLPDGWKIKQFTECIEKEASSNKLKIPQSIFQDKGKYPIVDQSTEYIAGYTDDSQKVYKGELPVIIFGDHTRIFKFVDFPFSLGADGTKILVPKKELLNPKYFYFFLNRLRIENHGYSRHYKFLKETQIVIPPIQTQEKIVLILEKAEETKKFRVQADEHTNKLPQSIFFEMFGDPAMNPKGWDIVTLKNVCDKITDGTHQKPTYIEKGVPFLSVKNITQGYLDLIDIKYISLEEHEKLIRRCKPAEGDILYTKVGVNYGIAELVSIKTEFSIYVSLALLKPNHKIINSKFFKYVLNSKYAKSQARERISGIGVPDLHLIEIKQIKIILPPLLLQQQFAQKVEKVETLSQNQLHSYQQIDKFFNTLMQKAFNGELTA